MQMVGVLVPLLENRWIDGGELVNLLNVLANRAVLGRAENLLRKRGHRYQALEKQFARLPKPLYRIYILT